ncbi:hypothetical protein SUGI_0752240 [Cryptomeria japonica]|nr:hypothetical protein SUGI_0752240 [Cryptomeria japonica]
MLVVVEATPLDLEKGVEATRVGWLSKFQVAPTAPPSPSPSLLEEDLDSLLVEGDLVVLGEVEWVVEQEEAQLALVGELVETVHVVKIDEPMTT